MGLLVTVIVLTIAGGALFGIYGLVIGALVPVILMLHTIRDNVERINKRISHKEMKMQIDSKKIHIMGASGSGTTTMGEWISKAFGHTHLDTDDYFWEDTDPPYTTKRSVDERLNLLDEQIMFKDDVVLTGSLCGWGDVLVEEFDLLIYINTPSDVRVKRLKQREFEKFGNRIFEGGDMYDTHEEFISWTKRYDTAGTEQRSFITHMKWLKERKIPTLFISGDLSMDEIMYEVKKAVLLKA